MRFTWIIKWSTNYFYFYKEGSPTTASPHSADPPLRPLLYVADAASASHGWSLMRSGELDWWGPRVRRRERGREKGKREIGPSLREKEGEKEVTDLLLWDRGYSCANSAGWAHRTSLDFKMNKAPLARLAAVTELR